ncbi:MAG: hypothetical protein WD577_04180 [Bacteroidales bacterium]
MKLLFPILPATGPVQWHIPEGIQKPASPYDLAFMSIPELAALLRSGQTTAIFRGSYAFASSPGTGTSFGTPLTAPKSYTSGW